ncbi:ABC transporter permease [Rhodanobacter sp. AS-Z3]|uniref:ABC transporter permease n=1 Tax=Rhodanobacter sp. AS-Z3 TaxID=3031330 RepID=UPI0024785097|nr:ABC transporter permease [Rhodanobacter sp. AS-Z3]WEN15992.1 ABC transporter permease [Rhodanobacter sp. AS-Z3]
MSKIVAVIRREFVERVRTKAFVISTLLLPVFMVAMVLLPAMMMKGGDRTNNVAVVDASSTGLGQPVSQALTAEKIGSGADAKARYTVKVFPATSDELAKVRDGLIASTGFSSKERKDGFDGVLVLTDDTLATGKVSYYGGNVGSMDSMVKLQSGVSSALAGVRLGKSGVDAALVKQAMKPANMETTKVSDGKLTGQSGAESFMIAYFMGFILYIAILIYGQQTMTSVIEEKTSRIMEVLTSSLTPFEMLLGKVLGVGLAGLTQMAIWGGTVFLISSQRVHLAGLFGMSADAAASFPIPGMAPGLLVVFLLYFALGFLLYGALYAAIGAMCNTIQETQQYAIFVTMFIIVGFFAVFALIKDPTGQLGVTLSFVPFFAPFTMPVRYSLTSVPPLELALSLGIMLVTLLACVWLAARIYRTGILMYGKKPSWSELWRWIRA